MIVETSHLVSEGGADRSADFARAQSFEAYLEGVVKNRELWQAVHRLARVPQELLDRVAAVPGRWQLLALSEDWCGDAVNTLPIVARLAAQAPTLEMRVLGRDANPALMDAHRSGAAGTARAIPVVMVLDERFVERGWWGSRPHALQQWFESEGRAMPKEERYPRIREWYARDRGRSLLEEIVSLIEVAAGAGVQ